MACPQAETGSPREILQLAYRVGFLSDEQVWLLIVNQLGITDTEHEVVPVLGRAGMWPAGNYPA